MMRGSVKASPQLVAQAPGAKPDPEEESRCVLW
jgi:hypothetical protein